MAQRAIEMPYYLSFLNGFPTRSGLQYCLRGSDGEEDDNSENEDDDDEETGSEGQNGKSADKDSDTDTDAEIERLRKRMKAADKNASTLAQRLKEYEDREKDETTKATERVKELESTVETQTAEIGKLRLHNAFLISNSYTWDDPEYALDFADRKGYLEDVVDDDGEIDQSALRKALDKLAKDKPRMIKKSDEDSDDDSTPPATDQGVGSKRKKDRRQVDTTDLSRRFPAAFLN